MIGFPRLENEDSHGIPMEQHRGEIESTTVNYSHTHTLETSHSLIQTRTRNANYSRKKKPECGQHRVVHCSRWDWGAECWVVVWCNIKTFTSFTTPNSSLLPVQSLVNPPKWNIARDWSFCEPPFRVNHLSATEMRVTDTSSCHLFSFARHFFGLDGTTVFIRAIRAGCQYIFLSSDQFWFTMQFSLITILILFHLIAIHLGIYQL